MSQINTDSLLKPGESLKSDNGLFILIYQLDGNLVTYDLSTPSPRALWSSRTYGSEPGILIFQNDGNLVIYNSQNKAIWHSHTYGINNGVCIFQDDGNLVIYSEGQPRWHAKGDDGWIFYPMLKPSERIHPGEMLKSPNKQYWLTYQLDGNLVLYDSSTSPVTVLWDAGSNSTPGEAIMQDDGNFVVYDSNGSARWNSQTYGKPSVFLLLQDDGNLVLYSQSEQSNSAVWNAKQDSRWRIKKPDRVYKCGWVTKMEYNVQTGQWTRTTEWECWWERA